MEDFNLTLDFKNSLFNDTGEEKDLIIDLSDNIVTTLGSEILKSDILEKVPVIKTIYTFSNIALDLYRRKN